MATTKVAAKKPRKIKIAHRKWYQLRRSGPKPVLKKLPKNWTIIKAALATVWRYRWLFVKIMVVFAILNLLLVRGFSGSGDAAYLKNNLVDAVEGGADKLKAGGTILAFLASSSGNTASEAASAYQTILLIVASLALIWTLRQISVDQKVRLVMRDAYYRGMTPLVPFICMVFIGAVYLLPFAAGALTYSTVIGYGIANGVVEYGLWALLLVATTAISFRIILSPLIGLYIVTLPDMTPIKALKSATQLIRYRRWALFFKLIFFIAGLLLAGSAIVLPTIFIFPPAAPWVYYIVVMIGLVITHSYLYNLYRELINHAP